MMVAPDGSVSQRGQSVGMSMGMSMPGYMSYGSSRGEGPATSMRAMPVLALINDSLNIRINGMNGAIIGRRKGPYTQFFEKQSYVSGVHAQLKYTPGVGWCVVDKHSSNGTMLNQRPVQPDVEMTLNSGDILTIANVNLQVIIS
jgi:pSer/pThr/pTyr-binding forkhead associated (FHA) protein